MRSRSVLGFAVLAACVIAPSIASAEDNRKPLSATDAAFLRQRAQDDVFMWRLGEYAASHGSTVQVRDLGKEISKTRQDDLRDIQQFNEDHRANLQQPKDLNVQQKTLYDRLTASSGLNFDKQYTKLLATELSKELAQYERMRDRASDPAVRDYAAKMASKVKEELQKAHDAEKTVWGM